jgi:hypothetical protein
VNEIVFEITQEADGGFCAECLTESIFTQADTWDELRANVKDAVEAFYFDHPKPAAIRLHLVRDEMLALGRSPRDLSGLDRREILDSLYL